MSTTTDARPRRARELTPVATLTQLMDPVFRDWADYARRPPPTRKLVGNWAWEREKTGFPAPVAALPAAHGGRCEYAYPVAEVLTWYLDRAAVTARR